MWIVHYTNTQRERALHSFVIIRAHKKAEEQQLLFAFFISSNALQPRFFYCAFANGGRRPNTRRNNKISQRNKKPSWMLSIAFLLMLCAHTSHSFSFPFRLPLRLPFRRSEFLEFHQANVSKKKNEARKKNVARGCSWGRFLLFSPRRLFVSCFFFCPFSFEKKFFISSRLDWLDER